MPRVGYHKKSDDSVTSFWVKDMATAITKMNEFEEDIDHIWVRNDVDNIVWDSHDCCPACEINKNTCPYHWFD